MTTQLGLPTQPRPDEIARKQSLGAAIELCADLAGFSLDKTLQQELGVDKAQFSRWQSGTEGIVWPKFTRLMDVYGEYISLGNYTDPKLAHEAYKAAASRLHGEFARAACGVMASV